MIFKVKEKKVVKLLRKRERVIKDIDYVTALEQVIEENNLCVSPADTEAEICRDMVDDFVRENNMLGMWGE